MVEESERVPRELLKLEKERFTLKGQMIWRTEKMKEIGQTRNEN